MSENNFTREDTSNGPEFHHVGVVDGDMIRQLFIDALPDIMSRYACNEAADRFMSYLRLDSFVIERGAGANVVEAMRREVETYDKLKAEGNTGSGTS